MSDPKHGEPLFSNLLLGAGAMKAGTTWLYSLLNTHPLISFCEEKEVHYFAQIYGDQDPISLSKRIRRFKRFAAGLDPHGYNPRWVKRRLRWFSAWLSEPLNDNWYRNLYGKLPANNYAGDFSNLTALLPEEGWKHIQRITERLRVIYIVRDPLERLWSHVKFHSHFIGKLDDFMTASPDEVIKLAKQDHIWKNGEYGKIVGRMKQVLKPEELLIIDFDDLHSNPRIWMKQIEDFLDIPPHQYDPNLLNVRINPSHSSKMPEYFVQAFHTEMQRIKSEYDAVLALSDSPQVHQEIKS